MSDRQHVSRKLKLILLLAVVALIYYVDFGRPRPTGAPGTNEFPASIARDYGWRDSVSGALYLIHEIDARSGDSTPNLNNPSARASPARIVVPYTLDPGLRVKTYQLYHKAKVAFALPPAANVSDLLIGETHLGPSQVQVARTITDLLRRYEVDAVFVEQPDDLSYDWSKLKSLEADPHGAIAALQHRMLDDARADLSPYISYLTDANSEEDALGRIERHLGASARQKAELALSTAGRYESSEYVSAVDYYYVALRLQGRMLAFQNVESRKLRDEFEAKSKTATSIEDLRGAIRARDEYMADKGSDVIRQNRYRRVIWIIGAEHLKSLPEFLIKQDHSITIAYNSLNTPKAHGYKKELMLLVKPDIFLSLARQGTNNPINQDLLPSAAPSQELLESVQTALLDPKLGAPATGERAAIVRGFESNYKTRISNPDGSWVVSVTVGPNETVEIKRGARGQYELERDWPANTKRGDHLNEITPGTVEIDPELRDRLHKLNANQSHVRVFTVKDTGRNYALYSDTDARPLVETNDIRALLAQVTSQLGPGAIESVYLELDGFKEDKAAAFESSCRIQSRQGAIVRSITTLPMSLDDAPLWNAFFLKALLDPNRPAGITVMDTGPFHGLLRASVHFLVMIGDKLQRITIEVYVRTKDIADQLVGRFRTLSLNQALTLADMVAVVRAEMKKEHNLSDEDVTVRLRQQVGGTLIVYAAPAIPSAASA